MTRTVVADKIFNASDTDLSFHQRRLPQRCHIHPYTSSSDLPHTPTLRTQWREYCLLCMPNTWQPVFALRSSQDGTGAFALAPAIIKVCCLLFCLFVVCCFLFVLLPFSPTDRQIKTIAIKNNDWNLKKEEKSRNCLPSWNLEGYLL